MVAPAGKNGAEPSKLGVFIIFWLERLAHRINRSNHSPQGIQQGGQSWHVRDWIVSSRSAPWDYLDPPEATLELSAYSALPSHRESSSCSKARRIVL
jgi:hypothetical protein